MNKPTPEQIEAAYNEMTKAYLEGLFAVWWAENRGEITFMTKTIETPEGGTYLLQFQHVSGPKIDVQKIFTDSSTPLKGE